MSQIVQQYKDENFREVSILDLATLINNASMESQELFEEQNVMVSFIWDGVNFIGCTTVAEIRGDDPDYMEISDSPLNNTFVIFDESDLEDFFDHCFNLIKVYDDLDEDLALEMRESVRNGFKNQMEQAKKSNGTVELGLDMDFTTDRISFSRWLSLEKEDKSYIFEEISSTYYTVNPSFDEIDVDDDSEERGVNPQPQGLGSLLRKKLFG